MLRDFKASSRESREAMKERQGQNGMAVGSIKVNDLSSLQPLSESYTLYSGDSPEASFEKARCAFCKK